MADGTGSGEVIHWKTAQSGVGYADPITLYESHKRIILFRPWFIRHATKPPCLAGKLEVWARNKQGFRVGIKPLDAISLGEEATARLLEALQTHSPVAEAGEGDYLVIRAGDRAEIGRDPAEVARAVVGLLRNEAVLERFAEEELEPVLLDALQGTLRLRELRLAVVELRDKLDGGTVLEGPYQDWCERHSWAFGLGYLDADQFRRISAGDDIDLLLPSIGVGYRDLAELKRPDHEVLRYDSSHKSYYWSPEASAAIGQCSRYLDVLHNHAQQGLLDHPEVVAWHPHATVVIGRSVDWEDEKHRALWALNDRLHGITVMTYDHLLAQGERLVSILSEQSAG